MRAYLPAYGMKVPGSLGEALDLLARDPDRWRPFAGGTDLMVLLEAGKLPHRHFLSIRHLPELRGIEETRDQVALGALTTYTQARRCETLAREFPMLCQAAAETGGVAIQNRGTLGGNVVNASPAADSPPALLCYDAELELVSAAGTRRCPYRAFHTGYKQMDLRPGELLRRIILPRKATPGVHFYRKVGTRRAQAISKVCFAGWAAVDGGGGVVDCRIALASVAPTVVRCPGTEAVLRGGRATPAAFEAARHHLLTEIAPIDDARSTAAYRTRVSVNLLAEFLARLAT